MIDMNVAGHPLLAIEAEVVLEVTHWFHQGPQRGLICAEQEDVQVFRVELGAVDGYDVLRSTRPGCRREEVRMCDAGHLECPDAA
ncbi:hypothetical protein [Rhodococcus koreensis]|uniref:hypothetical protein n=1 Tax=Rhodococcus koreensis TaxID=99653 RepID=UPI003672C782